MAGPSDRFEIAAPSCVAEVFGSEVVAINFDNGCYYSLRGLACAVWQDVLAGHSSSAICERLALIDNSIAVATAAFITDLERHGLIRRSDSGTAPARPIGCISDLQNGSAPPVIEIFNDMADLITADPTHEVDNESGWPVRIEP